MTTEPFIRRYRPEDRGALYEICVRTGEAGGDARHLYPDQDLLADVFAAPYATLEPDLAFVADDGTGRPVGYVLGTGDTPLFVERFREEWLPTVTDRHPDPVPPLRTPTDRITALLHRPERLLVPEVAGYPAHLHIDLLPGHQGAGHGRALMTRFLRELSRKGVPAVHLGMSPANKGARAFYDRMGFHEIPVRDGGPVTYLGRATSTKS